MVPAPDSVISRRYVMNKPNTSAKAHPMFKMAIQDNVFLQLEEGITPSEQRGPLPYGKLGYLYFYYVQNQPSLRNYVIKSETVAAYLQSKGLIDVDWDTRMFQWKRAPMTQLEFLRLFQQNNNVVTEESSDDSSDASSDEESEETEDAPAQRRAKARR
jgi:hypothetical protein